MPRKTFPRGNHRPGKVGNGGPEQPGARFGFFPLQEPKITFLLSEKSAVLPSHKTGILELGGAVESNLCKSLWGGGRQGALLPPLEAPQQKGARNALDHPLTWVARQISHHCWAHGVCRGPALTPGSNSRIHGWHPKHKLSNLILGFQTTNYLAFFSLLFPLGSKARGPPNCWKPPRVAAVEKLRCPPGLVGAGSPPQQRPHPPRPLPSPRPIRHEAGRPTCMQQLSMIMVSKVILGYSSATSSQQRRKSPSPSFLEGGQRHVLTLPRVAHSARCYMTPPLAKNDPDTAEKARPERKGPNGSAGGSQEAQRAVASRQAAELGGIRPWKLLRWLSWAETGPRRAASDRLMPTGDPSSQAPN